MSRVFGLARTYLIGDATAPSGRGPGVFAHVCNDSGGWGKGFVLAINRRWAEPEAAYRSWARSGQEFGLGMVQLVTVEEQLRVANMVAQHGYVSRANPVAIRYGALSRCLSKLWTVYGRLLKICTVLIKGGSGSRGGRNVRAPCDPGSGCPRTWPSGLPRVPSGTGQRPRAGQRWPPRPGPGAGFRLHRAGCGAGRLHTRGVPGSCRGEYRADRQPGRTGRGAAVVMKAASSPGRLSGHGRLLRSGLSSTALPGPGREPSSCTTASGTTSNYGPGCGACWLRCCFDSIWIIRCGGPVRRVPAWRGVVARRRGCWR
jgi:hypothetical protein